ncbi:MAG: hypothetical protein ACYDBA_03270 [Sulfuricaulis sp.]
MSDVSASSVPACFTILPITHPQDALERAAGYTRCRSKLRDGLVTAVHQQRVSEQARTRRCHATIGIASEYSLLAIYSKHLCADDY